MILNSVKLERAVNIIKCSTSVVSLIFPPKKFARSSRADVK